jgi:NitT/TauT family transport system substrate-binding protein
MLERMKDLMLPREAAAPSGKLSPEDYDRVATGLHGSGLIGGIPEFGAFYRKCADDDAK